MLRPARIQPLCSGCSKQLLDLFVGGFATAPPKQLPRARARATVARATQVRRFHASRFSRKDESAITGSNEPAQSSQQDEPPQPEEALPTLEQQQELRAREARQRFGELLPLDFLSVDEYKIYQRLYGNPVSFIRPEDEGLDGTVHAEKALDGDDSQDPADARSDQLLEELEDGTLQEVDYSIDPKTAPQAARKLRQEMESEGTLTGNNDPLSDELDTQDASMLEDLQQARLLSLEEASETGKPPRNSEEIVDELDDVASERRVDEAEEAGDEVWNAEKAWQQAQWDNPERPWERTHPLTEAGRFATYPRTVRLPAAQMTEPIQTHLANNARYDHLIEAAEKTFGGNLLPDSNATPPKNSKDGRHFQQKVIPLSAAQHKMSQLEANLFLSTIMPGAYATTLSILVEVRKRLGSSWLETLLNKPGGPRILDAGGAGSSVLAWREVLQAEWDRMHEDSGRIAQDDPNLGRSTVLAGSHSLQSAVSHLLSDTSFIPRLPDFTRQVDMKIPEDGGAPTRKQYDLVVAPYSIWQIEEDYMKKAHLQNLWSLLEPNGGVLILFEKGLPRGFEAIAEARQVLLSHHIKNPQKEVQKRMEAVDHSHTQMEDGMIIAPCTNHTKCPLYTIPGEMSGRKDFCSFQQRFERPPFLQRIHGASFHNYEDISFSYIAVQRGRDLRQEGQGFRQDEKSTQEAFVGFQDSHEEGITPSMLALPRILSPPLKKTGHILFDMCTPQGTYERWITPRSFSKRAYRDGRKAKWGDLWALGAKTRFGRDARTGRPRDERAREKQLQELEDLGPETDGLRKLVEKQVNPPRRLRREDRGWKAKIGRKDKYGTQPKDWKTKKMSKALEEE